LLATIPPAAGKLAILSAIFCITKPKAVIFFACGLRESFNSNGAACIQWFQ
jgi:hypothetical protein